LEKLQIINQPTVSIAKKEEILYVLGREHEPIVLEHHSPVLHLIQQIRDETHRFAVSFHRQRRGAKQTKSALLDIPGIGPKTSLRLLQRFGSIANLRRASHEELAHMLGKKSAEKVVRHLEGAQLPTNP
jgi:excinuclease ABC subunit C